MSSRGPGPERPKRDFAMPRAEDRLEGELEDEFRFHMEERIEEFVAAGLSREEAEREAQRRFGDREAYLHRTKDIDSVTLSRERRAEWGHTVRRELQRAARVLLRDRAFSIVAFLTLAVGLGATTAIATVLDAVVLRALPYRDAQQLVSVMHPATVPGSGQRNWGLSPGSYFGFRNGTNTLSDLGMYASSSFTVTNGGDAELVQVARVTASLFSTLGAQPAAGRLLLADDDVPGGPQVAVLSHEFFTRRFGGDVTMIGRMLETSVGSYEIVGVAEPGLALPMPGPFSSSANLSGFSVEVWTPLQLDPAGPFFNNHPYVGVGRLRPGVSVEDAQREFVGLFGRIAEDLPRVYSPGFLKQYAFGVQVASLRDSVLGPTVPRALWLLFGAVLLVLCIAAANVGNLFLLRFEARRRESAIRTALGAARGQMAVHYLAETLLLCLAAAAAGVVIAIGGLRALLAIAPTNIPRLSEVTLGARSIGVAVLAALLLGLILGVVPLIRRGLDVNTLRDGGRGLSPSPRLRRVRHALVVGQLALTLVLLAAAGLMLRSFEQLRRVEPGFDAQGVLAFEISLPFLRYDTREKAAVFHQELQRRVGALPGVRAVGAGPVPLEEFGTGCSVVFREARPFGPDEQTPCVPTPTAIPGYFEALGIPVEGRRPNWNDVAARSQAVVVTRALADRLWPGEDAIGKGIASNGQNSSEWYRIVGVIPSLRAEALDLAPTEAVFYAATGLQANVRSGMLNDLTIFVRSDGDDPYALLPAIREELRTLDPQVPIVSPRPMGAVVAGSMARTSFVLTMLGVAAGVALLLSAVGIYGVIAYLVTQRRTEIGIRLALGATVAEVVWLVVRQSATIAVLGVGLGLAAALGGSRVLASLLYEVQPADPVVLAIGTLLVLAVVVLASWVPAQRAARVDPAEALRDGS
ncbi:MAG: ABC transporter permease [Gemmatimonadaceae bacterium]|nr:ABC transporter permease [Gemmatimonadaceae bacterium]MCW5826472.1 ABC transporter permease [Gemmatimonadaceae bacterium]